jgi:hypothetical protein
MCTFDIDLWPHHGESLVVAPEVCQKAEGDFRFTRSTQGAIKPNQPWECVSRPHPDCRIPSIEKELLDTKRFDLLERPTA